MTGEDTAERLRSSLREREIIAQAQGVVMGRQGGSAEDAHAILRRSARHAGVTVRERAVGVLAGARRKDLIGQVERDRIG